MISQIELITAICRELDRQKVKSLAPRQYNAIIKSVDAIIAECERQPVMSSSGMGLQNWLVSDDVGMSSRYMASVLGGFSCDYAHPHDLDDFGRCSRLLLAVPEFRERLPLMQAKSKEWAALLGVWNQVEHLMQQNEHHLANKIVMEAVSSD